MVVDITTKEIIVQGSGGGKSGGNAPHETPDNLRSKSTARLVDIVSEGPIFGLVDGAKSIMLNSTPLQRQDDTYNFKGVEVVEFYGTPDQDAPKGFQAVRTPVSMSAVVLKYNIPQTVQITDADTDAIALTFSVNTFFETKDNGDIVGSKVSVDIHINNVLAHTMVIQGKQDGSYDRQVRIDMDTSKFNAAPWDIKVTRTTADSTTLKIQNDVSWKSMSRILDTKIGYAHSAGFGVTVDSESFGNSIPTRSYHVKGRLIKVPSNYNASTKEYSGVWDGTFTSSEVYSNNPAYVFRDLVAHYRYGLGQFIDQAQIPDPALYIIGKYCDERVWDGLILQSVSGITRSGSTATATQNAHGKVVNDYVYINGADQAEYNGVFKITAVTVNTYSYTVAGTPVTPATGTIRSGKTEPRFSINTQITKPDHAINVLNKLVSVFRGMMYYLNNKITPVIDMPKEPVLTVANANVIDGEFSYSGNSQRVRHSVVYVSWNNPANHYKKEVYPVEDRDLMHELGFKYTTIEAFGVTSKGQAARVGKWFLDSEATEDEFVVYKAAFDHAALVPGDVILISDKYYDSTETGGRVQSATTTSVDVDREIVIPAGPAPDIYLYNPEAIYDPDATNPVYPVVNNRNDMLIKRTLTNGAGTFTTLTWTDALTANQVPDNNGLFLVTIPNTNVRQFRVLTVTEDGPDIFEVNAMIYDPDKFARVEAGAELDEPDKFDLPDFNSVLPPDNLNISLQHRISATKVDPYLEIKWDASTDKYLAFYEVFYKYDSGNWERLAKTTSTSIKLEKPPAGDYAFTVEAVNKLNIRSNDVLQTFALVDNTRPADFTDLEVNNLTLFDGSTSTYTGKHSKFKWGFTSSAGAVVQATGTLTGKEDPIFKHYKVEVLDPNNGDALLRTETVYDPYYEYTYEKNFEDTSGSPIRQVKVVVIPYDVYNFAGTSATLTVNNPPPALPSNLSAASGIDGVSLSYDKPTDPDFVGVMIYVSSTQGFTVGAGNLKYDGPDTMVFIDFPTSDGANIYIRLQPYDAFAKSGLNLSSELTVTNKKTYWSDIGGSGKPEDGATVGDPYGSSYNLLGSDAGPVAGPFAYRYYTLKPIIDLGLSVGDIVNCSALMTSTNASASNCRIIIDWFDASNALISRHNGTFLNGVFTDSLTKIENLEIPANTVKVDVIASGATTVDVTARSAMFSRGPVAVPYVAPYEDGADITDYTDTRIKNDGRVPDNIHVGGFGDLRFTKNQVANGSSNDGEIRVQGTKFYHPDGTTRTLAETSGEASTPFEWATVRKGVFYLIWTDTNPGTRFSGYFMPGANPATNFFIAEYDWETKQWTAVDNTQSTWNFTPLDTDCVVAIGTKTLTSGGIGTLSSFLGANANLPEDGATVGDPYGANFNLLGNDAGPPHSPLSYTYLATIPIADLDLAIGDSLSFSVLLTSNDSAATNVRMMISYYTSSDVFIRSDNATMLQGSFSETLNSFDNSVIPETCAKLRLLAGYSTAGNSSLLSARRAMLNRGPVALPYVAPYEDGSTVGADWETNLLNPPVSDGAMNKDAGFTGVAGAWKTFYTGGYEITVDSEFAFVTEASSPALGPTILRCTSSDDFSDQFHSDVVSIDATKTYRVTCWVRQPTGTKRNYLLVGFLDSNNVRINSGSNPVSDAIGWPSVGTYHYYGLVNVAGPSTWTKYSVVFGPDQAITMPSNAVKAFVGALVLRDVYTPTVIEFAAMSIEEVTPLVWSGVLDDDGNRPDNNATVGATQGVDFFKPGGSIPYDSIEFENQLITLNTGGWLNNIGTTEIIQNAKINVDGSGAIQGIGTGAGKIVDNSDLALNSTGQLTYAGGTINLGAVTASDLGVRALGFLDNADWSAHITGTGKPDDNATRQVNRGDYSAATTYSKGDVVTSSGTSYEYINGTPSSGNAPPNATYWALLAAHGNTGNYKDFIWIVSNDSKPATPTGNNPAGWVDYPPVATGTVWSSTGLKDINGVLIGSWSVPRIYTGAFQGAYSSVATYFYGDTVTWDGGTRVCTDLATDGITNIDPDTAASWDTVAQQGDTGETPVNYNGTITITSNTSALNLKTLALNDGWDGVGDCTLEVIINSGVEVLGSSSGGDAIRTGGFPAVTLDLKVTVSGKVWGGGGPGGGGGTNGSGANGADGGNGINLEDNLTLVVNSGGEVYGGSGGGGGGGNEGYYVQFEPDPGNGGSGGGGGWPNGLKGSAGGFAPTDGNDGAAGTTSAGGAGGSSVSGGGAGGAGGNKNAAGVNGGSGSGTYSPGGGGVKGALGAGVKRNGFTLSLTNNGVISSNVN